MKVGKLYRDHIVNEYIVLVLEVKIYKYEPDPNTGIALVLLGSSAIYHSTYVYTSWELYFDEVK